MCMVGSHAKVLSFLTGYTSKANSGRHQIVWDSKLCTYTSKSGLVCRQITVCAQNLISNCQFRIAVYTHPILFMFYTEISIFTFPLDVLPVGFFLDMNKAQLVPCYHTYTGQYMIDSLTYNFQGNALHFNSLHWGFFQPLKATSPSLN